MMVIYIEPGKNPVVRDIPNELEALQAAVGGYIETVTLTRDCVVICDEEGLLKGKPFNIRIAGIPFVGPIVVAGVDGEEFTDATKGLIELYEVPA